MTISEAVASKARDATKEPIVANPYFVREGVDQKTSVGSTDFALSEQQQSDDLHAPCERVRHAWQRHEIG